MFARASIAFHCFLSPRILVKRLVMGFLTVEVLWRQAILR